MGPTVRPCTWGFQPPAKGLGEVMSNSGLCFLPTDDQRPRFRPHGKTGPTGLRKPRLLLKSLEEEAVLARGNLAEESSADVVVVSDCKGPGCRRLERPRKTTWSLT